jgi:alpha-N-arabinofuranosidase
MPVSCSSQEAICAFIERVIVLACAFVLFSHSLGLTQSDKEFTNPILAGFYPDPSICRVGSDYYLVTSSFAYFPGIPIFHSKDLANWNQLGHVMDRPEQMNLDGLGVSRGIFAPAISENDGVFYVTCTLVDAGGNFVVTATNPAGPWSNPVWIPEINGIDPSLFFDGEGKAYILYNSIPPDGKPLYDGHRTIRMYEFDIENSKVTGEEAILVNGGVDISKKPVWIEGPHIFKKDGYYFLIASEGGTAHDHSEVVFRSKKIAGPYVPYEKNPILTQRHLDPKREFPIMATGHADFVETQNGDWWAVFLGSRPYEEDYFNTGRETFLAPVKWIDGWPVINPAHEEVQYSYPFPLKPQTQAAIPHRGNFTYRDEFDGEKLNYNWVFLRTPPKDWLSLTERNGSLALRVRPESCSNRVNPSFVGHRQQHLVGSASIALNFSPQTENEKVGLLIFQSERYFYFICKSRTDDSPVIQLYKSAMQAPNSTQVKGSTDDQMSLMTSQPIENDDEVFLKIEARGDTYAFWHATDSNNWQLLMEDVDAKPLSTREAGGFSSAFVGCIYALYATSLGESSASTAYFNWFETTSNDEVYK